jgi:electron transfer flavoprotein beta subunit
VMETMNSPRPPAAKKMMKYKKARVYAEVAGAAAKELGEGAAAADVEAKAKPRAEKLKAQGLLIEQWTLDDIKADLTWCGRSGSPTKVHRIQSVVLTAREQKMVEGTDAGVKALVAELIQDHTLG